ncbi:DNA-binding transcriptional LysR family regulator [Streptomyces sp. SAI-135]|uniref:LysR family transcriptional regulator n=1 Tax=unclassified Streptomyces TaxID=2593676 RepID=UPI0024756AFD|nr:MULTISPECIES: LysR family transcriptional regulator [unclassified Streptomyces]MDH6520921.1 DNA-binding transcriptional LysR family regulator [Streptomyces sp. SAI-090]MDH6553141.1 DNA-binding transcriptional LysR family regulator [Streptomyces sp. SAI-041]MDH6572224.1 DNA-binding transcriptional LysR family regulator [Streptomyces sp. SAI-117]MDH6582818.1 DNA-binding transcriptional LysR family regulator [Streptomyces sp. SAI-133]MDH6614985.1 DNA-binding transcriptional LysR family regulat
MRDRFTNGSEDPGHAVGGPLDLNLLRTFLTVYRTGSFTAAARLLGLSQPTVTTQVRSLERQVCRELFERRARGVTPVPYADELAARIVQPLDSLAAVAGPSGSTEDGPAEPVHLGGPAELLSRCVLPGLASLVDRGVRLRVTPGLTEPLLDDLRAGRHDLVIATFRPRGRTLTAVPLNDEEFVLVASPAWALRLGAPEHLAAALHGVPLIAYAEDLPIVRRYWRHVFGRRLVRQPALTMPDLNGVKAAVAGGAGFTVLPRYLCADELASGALVLLHDPDDPPINTGFLVQRPGTSGNPHVALVRDHLLQSARDW